MRARQCDVCQEMYPEEEVKNQDVKIYEFNIDSYRKSSVKDLCPTCYDNLLKFLHMENIKEKKKRSK